MARTQSDTVKEITNNYLDNLDKNNLPSPADIEADILDIERTQFIMQNDSLDKGSKWKIPTELTPNQISTIMLYLYPIRCISCAGNNTDTSYDLLAIYCDSGENEGIYVTDDKIFHNKIRLFNYNITKRGIEEVMFHLKDQAPRCTRCLNKNLIAVNNGIFDYVNKQLLPFDENIVFIAKSKVNYNSSATNVTIHNPDDNTDWDVEDWMNGLSDDPEIVQVLWEVLGAIIRPYVKWNKSAWFYSNTGNNGKGTLCALMRNLCGDGSYASIPLSDFSKDFALEPLTRATSIIVDENDVGIYIDKAANLKAIITNDVISVNRKFKTPIAYQFFGFMVQCLNEYPRIKDRSDSFYRRQLFIPFDKCFTGQERKYIKDDYLKRPEVLEYVMYKVLNMTYYTLSEPQACKNALDEYKDFNDPLRQFVDEFISQCVWDFLPFSFLYDGYKAWFKKNSPSGTLQGKNTFITDVINLLGVMPEWSTKGRTKAVKPGHKMDKPEPLILQYDLKDWMNPLYHGTDVDHICTPIIKATYNGLIRVGVYQGIPADDTDNEEES